MCMPYLKILPYLSFFPKIFGWSYLEWPLYYEVEYQGPWFKDILYGTVHTVTRRNYGTPRPTWKSDNHLELKKCFKLRNHSYFGVSWLSWIQRSCNRHFSDQKGSSIIDEVKLQSLANAKKFSFYLSYWKSWWCSSLEVTLSLCLYRRGYKDIKLSHNLAIWNYNNLVVISVFLA